MRSRWGNNPTAASLGTLIVFAAALLATGGAASAALVSPAAPLPSDEDKMYFGTDLGATFTPAYGVFTFEMGTYATEEDARKAALQTEGYSFVVGKEADFDKDGQGKIKGTLYSEVWKDTTDEHNLLLYRYHNSGTEMFQQGKVYNIDKAVGIIDCGVIRTGDADTFVHGDLVLMWRMKDWEFVEFYYGNALITYELLDTGETSSWLYLESATTSYGDGYASIMDGGAQYGIPTYIPVPEPGTVCILAAGMAGVLLRNRRRRATLKVT